MDMMMTYHTDPSGLALRRVKIRREENGFGFTLRHFIVYPPELYANDDEGRNKNLVKVTEPVDTIFVRSIVETGPADRAGLCVGDRIVSVNGRTIFGTSYDTVVQLIQTTPDILCLEVSPKQYDTLQLFFEETAYRPETNQRPYHPHQKSRSKKSNLASDPYSYPYYYNNDRHLYYEPIYGLSSTAASTESFFLNTDHHGSNSMSSPHPQQSSSSSSSNPQLLSHLPRPTPYKSTSVWSSSTPPRTFTSSTTPRPQTTSSTRSQFQTYYPFNQDVQPSSGAPPHLWKIKEEPSNPSGAKSAENIMGSNNASNIPEFHSVGYDASHRTGSMECLNRVPGGQQQPERSASAGNNWNPIRSGGRFASYDEAGTSQTEFRSSQRRESTGSIPNSTVPTSAMVVTMSSTNSKMQSSYQPTLSDSGSSIGGQNNQEYEHRIVDRIRRSCEQKEEFLKRPNQPLVWAPLQSSSTNTFPKELYAQPQKFEKIPWPPAHIVPTVTSTRAPPIHSCYTNSGSLDSQVKNVSGVSMQQRTTSPNAVKSESDVGNLSQNSATVGSYEPRSLSPSWLEYVPKNRTMIVGGRKLHCDPPAHWTADGSMLPEMEGPQDEEEGAGEVKLRVRNSDLDETERLVRRVSYLKATSSPIDMDRKSTSPTSPAALSPTSEYRGFGNLVGVRSPDSSEVTREGSVHYKIRIGETKKGGYNRSWRQGWAQIRRSGCLYIAKEPLSRETVAFTDDSVILALSLRSGVTIESAEDYSKRKHVLRVKTSYSSVDIANMGESNISNPSAHPPLHSTPVEILIQADDANDCMLWLQTLHTQLENNNYYNGNNANNNFKGIYFGPDFCPKSKSLLTSFLPSPVTSQSSDKTTATTTSASVNVLQPPPSASSGPQSATSPKNRTWKGKVARQWKKVHNIIETGGDSKGSSPYSSLPPVGATFGINLENCPPGENNPLIPRVIEYAISVVERRGIDMVGLYRIPGNNASVGALTERLNRGEDPNPEKDPKWLDVHVLASLIKSFLRRLPDPLLTDDRYQAFIIAADDDDQDRCKERMQMLISDLPDTNYETLRVVIMHLKNVSQHGENNRMDARNLAIVFGPTIVRTAEENVTSMVQDMKNQCKIVEFLISNADELFKERRYKPGSKRTSESEALDQIQSYSIKDAIRLPAAAPMQLYKSAESTGTLRLSASSPTIEHELKASIVKAALRKASKDSAPVHNIYGLPSKPPSKSRPVDERGFIRSYAGLNEETEQRVKRFEQETRAMLSREDRSPHASIINMGSRLLAGGSRLVNLDDELERAREDLENEDIYDQLADNPSSIVHHRDRGIFTTISGQRNLSNSSISSSNSNGTVQSHTSTQKLAPTPFRLSHPSQSLPPKPPQLHNSGSSVGGPSSLQSKSSLSASSSPSSPLRRVSSMDRFGSDQEHHHETILQEDTTLRVPSFSPKYFGGSLDSLKDISHVNGQEEVRNGHSRRDGVRSDLSPRSSDGSDMVTSLTKALDRKLQKLRSDQPDNTTQDAKGNDNKSGDEINRKSKSESKPTNSGKSKGTDKTRKGGNGIKRSWRRFSLIERRVNGELSNGTGSSRADKEYYRNPSLYRDGGIFIATIWNQSDQPVTVQPKTSSKLTRDCRRRHSLSGGGDILSIAYHDKSIRYLDDCDPQSAEGPAFTPITRAGILESHV